MKSASNWFMKTCRDCGKSKCSLDFYSSVITPDGRSTYCKSCQKSRQNKKKYFSYGVTEEDFDRMHEEQKGLCFICHKPETKKRSKNGDPARLAIDHCHKKGHVRRLLCTRCNTGLGMFLDRPELLRTAADYLEEHNEPAERSSGDGTTSSSTEEKRSWKTA